MQLLHVEQLGDRTEGSAVIGIAAQHHVVGAHLLGHAINGRPRRQQVQRNAGVVEGVAAIVAADDVKPRRRHAVGENFREGFANPLQAGKARLVLEWHDQKRLRAGKRLPRRWLAQAEKAKCRQERKKRVAKSETRGLQSNSIIAVAYSLRERALAHCRSAPLAGC